MALTTQLQELLHKDMTRKQFLTTIGVIILGFMGIGPILKLLFGKHPAKPQTVSSAPTNYGHLPSA